MKTITCYVIDDEFRAISLLSKFIEETPGYELTGSSENPMEALPFILSAPPDLLLVDIHMPQISGLDFSKMVPKQTALVFTTAYAEHAIRAFDLKATDYLLKPFTYERFIEAVTRVWQPAESPVNQYSDDYFFIKVEMKGKLVQVAYEEINYVEAAQNYLTIFLDDTKYLTYLTMKEMEAQFEGRHFMRIHKSYIVNIRKISSVQNSAVILKNRTMLLIGTKYRDEFMKQVSLKTLVSKRG
ncbi:LytR/AlgR family response regulator transcription factor [Hufsiella ginkgonis]|uniref:Response regulator n=1 Tax=Hufsiella ginkgonis TaxID=2695274 RepID=A0A7K1XYQ8_9SPHI|nr:LytTR family DNA-binding domain-containing protein [Hufsiella ginkgonis]MXV16082.1 response regulator [Hufsiella ginkgonis]